MDTDTLRLWSIFDPDWIDRRQSIIDSHGRFVHYTSADNAMKIIQTKSLWMRNARCMNDYNEINHGYKLLRKILFEDRTEREFENAIDSISEKGVAKKIFTAFNGWWEKIQFNTFISSISEHDQSEDVNGRLSMWRGYGEKSVKTAMVVNISFEPPAAAVEKLALFLRPVAYRTEEELCTEISRVIDNITENASFLSAIELDHFIGHIFVWLILTTVCLKHKGFEEEKEWRIIYLPEMRSSEFMSCDVETIQGVPQIVYKMPLKNIPEKGINGISIPEILDRIIVGPTEYPYPIFKAFKYELEKVGVENAASRVVVSDIPLRT